MARKKNVVEKLEISESEKLKMNRRARREAEIDLGIKPYKTKVHKNKTKYNRKVKHKNMEFAD